MNIRDVKLLRVGSYLNYDNYVYQITHIEEGDDGPLFDLKAAGAVVYPHDTLKSIHYMDARLTPSLYQ